MPSDDSDPLADMLLVLLARNKLLECTYENDIKNVFISMIVQTKLHIVDGLFPVATESH